MFLPNGFGMIVSFPPLRSPKPDAHSQPLYTAAHDAKPLPALLFNIAQCHRQLGNHERALFFYRRHSRRHTHCHPGPRCGTGCGTLPGQY